MLFIFIPWIAGQSSNSSRLEKFSDNESEDNLKLNSKVWKHTLDEIRSLVVPLRSYNKTVFRENWKLFSFRNKSYFEGFANWDRRHQQ